MKSHPNGKIQIPDEDFPIWEQFDFRCILCNEYAVCLHECPPKSRNRNWKNEPEHRYPVCNRCHERLTSGIPWKQAKIELEAARKLKQRKPKSHATGL